jgi:hypothetical protein
MLSAARMAAAADAAAGSYCAFQMKFMPCWLQNYGPTSPSNNAEFKEEQAVLKSEYSLYQPKPAKKVIRRVGLKQHGTQHLRMKSHAWHS